MCKNSRRHMLLCLSLILAFMFVSCAGPVTLPADDVLTVTFIDVSKGDCILLQKAETAILIDAGYDATASTVLYYLQSHGIEHLDYMIITHYDKDHVGGAAYLVNNLSVGKVLLPDYEPENKYYDKLVDALETKNVPSQIIDSNLSITLSEVEYTVFASTVQYTPGSDGKEGNDNDCSLVISALYLDSSFLFTGDIEKAGIKAFLKTGPAQYDVVKMPHHGSFVKNTEDLLNALQPSVAVITDSNGEPAESDLLDMLSTLGTKVCRSSVNGNITLTTEGNGDYSITTEK